MATITSRDRVKRMLRIPAGVTHADALVDDVIEGVEADLLDAIGLPAGITLQNYTETVDIPSHNASEFPLRYRPVRSIAGLTDNGSAVGSGDYHWSENGWVRLTGFGAEFTMGRQTVQVTYAAGYAGGVAPADLVMAATLMSAREANVGPHAGMIRETLGKYGYEVSARGQASTMLQGAEATIARILAKYQRIMPRGY